MSGGHGIAFGADETGDFRVPPRDSHPQTWFHLIGGNVSREGLTRDLEAVADAGISGIQLFHGSGGEWPGVQPQIQCLSPQWDAMIGHVAAETGRLGLKFTMQNCPGWAMSGGPWIQPENAMRHLILSRVDVAGGSDAGALKLPQPSLGGEPWRDYRDIAVMAFPTPEGDSNKHLNPRSVKATRNAREWAKVLSDAPGDGFEIEASNEATVVEFELERGEVLRTITLPPVSTLMKTRYYDPETRIGIEVPDGDGWRELTGHEIPRGTWQDNDRQFPLVLAVPDAATSRYRMVIRHRHALRMDFCHLGSAARMHDWRAQAAYALRSLDRKPAPGQSPQAWVDPGRIIDLSERMDASGKLSWEVPAGNWTVLRFGHVNTGARNQPAPPEATGFECDKLSPAGAETHFAGYIGRLSEPGGPAEGRLSGLLTDSWECRTQTWTPAMEVEFKNRRGYALRGWLPALGGWVVSDPRTTERFLRDWRATISDLIVDHYYGRMAELAAGRGLTTYFETGPGDVSPGDILQYFGKADVPMCEFWQPNDPDNAGFESKPVKPTVSAAHIYGKPRVAAEAFTQVPVTWDEHPFAMKSFADRHLALGVTHLVFHTYTHNPLERVPGTSFGRHIGSPFLRGQTWWEMMPDFTAYLARCQTMLERGLPVADVLWYLGDDLDHKPVQHQPFPEGYRFTYLNADVLENRLRVVDGNLAVPEGTNWRVLWLPREQCARMTPQSLRAIRDLLVKGALVIGGAPEANATLAGGAKADADFTALIAGLWGENPQPRGDRRIGQGRLLWGGGLAETLRGLGIGPDVAGARPDSWMHRRDGDTEIYFVTASRLDPLDANLKFRAKGKPELWDPMTGETRPLVIHHVSEDGISIPLRLPAAGSAFVVFRPEDSEPVADRITLDGEVLIDAADATRVDGAGRFPKLGLTRAESVQPWVDSLEMGPDILADGRRILAWRDGEYRIGRNGDLLASVRVSGTGVVPIDAGWSLSFPPGWGAPERIETGPLKPWSSLEDPAARHFSGTAIYSVAFDAQEATADERVVLDLGKVCDLAEIKLNGETLARKWAPPFRVDVTGKLRNGRNHLEIKVTNTWRNRLIFEQSLPPGETRTWTLAPPARDAKPAEGGLFGPVRILKGRIVSVR
jgi:hypothetical protein